MQNKDITPSIVVGAGFGDEGKGLTTSWRCANTEKPLVVRFNGGHQAGHQVNYNGKKHIFSSFGSGTLQGVPTYWSEYCTFHPSAFLNEYQLLKSLKPLIYVNPLCPVTTFFDVDFNRLAERTKANGSVGVGFGATIQRQEAYYKLFVQDLFHEKILLEKLKNIANYYGRKYDDYRMEEFLEVIREVKNIITLSDNSIIYNNYNPIFEGAQGILLDMDFGFFPNVTRSNTTSKNALKLCEVSGVFNYTNTHEIYYVTRCYTTRHGRGYMGEGKPVTLKNNEGETNKSHEFQGEFRTSEMDFELLNYALECDNNFSKGVRKNLVITCTDQLDTDIDLFLSKVNTSFDKVFISNGNSLDNISEVKVYGKSF